MRALTVLVFFLNIPSPVTYNLSPLFSHPLATERREGVS